LDVENANVFAKMKDAVIDGNEGNVDRLSACVAGQRSVRDFRLRRYMSYIRNRIQVCTGHLYVRTGVKHDNPRSCTQFVLISRAPLEKLEAYKARKGWDRP
jgi:predicted dithiol-disulfide oxidoreductase (DUF899 family)